MQNRNTPWGHADHVKDIGAGILAVTTPSHGGYFVPPELYAQMPPDLRHNPYGKGTWFEEDCEWSLVALAFPQYFNSVAIIAAVDTLTAYSTPGTTYHAAYLWLRDTPAGREILKIKATAPDLAL